MLIEVNPGVALFPIIMHPWEFLMIDSHMVPTFLSTLHPCRENPGCSPYMPIELQLQVYTVASTNVYVKDKSIVSFAARSLKEMETRKYLL